jgi:hypothetical protein
MCDYWILCEQGEETPVLYVLLCELKSGKPEDAIPQIENAKLLAEYILEMVGHHKKLGKPEAQYRGLVFSRAHRFPKAGLKLGKMVYTPMGRLQTQVALLGDGTEYWLSSLCA